MAKFSIMRFITVVFLGALTTGMGYLGYRALRGEIAAGVYRDRLAMLVKDYEGLRETYNRAIRRAAVTELIVKNGAVTLQVRSPEGTLQTIPTSLDPSNEIYVDYVVLDGRLLIRRVFDAHTPPARAQVIDANLAGVDWDDPRIAHGKAVYRRLTDGRWIVSVTGNGALGLLKDDESRDAPALVAAPAIKDYSEALEQADARLNDITMGDVLRRMVGASP